ncbi:hypothetical protein CEXT_656731 [Caerostris extrusa]|uniref:Uncharacterized protein n=1 Tax=Caerostris extrusa TaxID=172846 RepID=A0AAV4XC99_CAEEX|nr:hypothetical protein CEXT_656731 [Caerostris extrusa]
MDNQWGIEDEVSDLPWLALTGLVFRILSPPRICSMTPFDKDEHPFVHPFPRPGPLNHTRVHLSSNKAKYHVEKAFQLEFQ